MAIFGRLSSVNELIKLLDVLPIREVLRDVLERRYGKYRTRMLVNYWIQSLLLTNDVLRYNKLMDRLSQEIFNKLVSELLIVLKSITTAGTVHQLYSIKKGIDKMRNNEYYEGWKRWPTILTSTYLLLRLKSLECYVIPKLFFDYKGVILRHVLELIRLKRCCSYEDYKVLSYLCDSFLEFIDELLNVSEDYCKDYELYNGVRELLYDRKLFEIINACKTLLNEDSYSYALCEIVKLRIMFETQGVDVNCVHNITNIVNNVVVGISKAINQHIEAISRNQTIDGIARLIYDISWLLFNIVRLYDKVILLNKNYNISIDDSYIEKALVEGVTHFANYLNMILSRNDYQSYIRNLFLRSRRSDIVPRILSPITISLSLISSSTHSLPLLILSIFYTDVTSGALNEVLSKYLTVNYIFSSINNPSLECSKVNIVREK